MVSSKLTRDDEEVTVAFPDPKVGIKRLLASLANLELVESGERPEPTERRAGAPSREAGAA